MELSQLYQAILASMNVTADEDGLLSLTFGDVSHAATVEGKRLVLPTDEVLRAGIGPKRIAFHPLSENILRGESAVLKKLKTYITTKLTQVIQFQLEAFVNILADHKRHGKLTPAQKELLLTIPDADDKTYQALEKIIEAMAADSKRKLVTVYLKRGGKLRLESYARVAVVAFPIMAEFENDESVVFGVKLRKKDFAGFQRLFEYILPGCESSTTYSLGSNDAAVPYFDALMRAFVVTATQLNSRTDDFKKHLEEYQDLHIDLSWATPAIPDWNLYRDKIPPLDGNDGVTAAEEESEARPAHASTGAQAFDPARAAASRETQPVAHPTYQSAPHPTTSQPEQPAIRSTSGGLNWQDVISSANRRSLQPVATAPAPAVYNYPTQGGYPQPVMMDPRMMGQPYMEPPPPGFGPAPGQQPQQPMVDAYGRVMATPMVAPPMAMDPRMMGQPMMMDPRMMDPRMMAAMAPPPGFGAPPGFGQPMMVHQQPGRQPSFGPGVGQPMMYDARMPSFGVQPAGYQQYMPQGNTPVYRY